MWPERCSESRRSVRMSQSARAQGAAQRREVALTYRRVDLVSVSLDRSRSGRLIADRELLALLRVRGVETSACRCGAKARQSRWPTDCLYGRWCRALLRAACRSITTTEDSRCRYRDRKAIQGSPPLLARFGYPKPRSLKNISRLFRKVACLLSFEPSGKRRHSDKVRLA
jgi:hypothetical protein